MSSQKNLIGDLETLNDIAQILNQAVDVRTALVNSHEQLVQLMGLETGWIFIREPAADERWAGYGFQLAAHYRLPPAMDISSRDGSSKNSGEYSFGI